MAPSGPRPGTKDFKLIQYVREQNDLGFLLHCNETTFELRACDEISDFDPSDPGELEDEQAWLKIELALSIKLGFNMVDPSDYVEGIPNEYEVDDEDIDWFLDHFGEFEESEYTGHDFRGGAGGAHSILRISQPVTYKQADSASQPPRKYL